MGVRMRGRSTSATTVELVHQSGATFGTMAPLDNGGDGSTFSPTDLCAVSLGACGTTIMSLFARDKGIGLEGIEFDLEKEMASSPRRIAKLTIRYRLKGGFPDRDFDRLVAAGKACPVRVTFGDRIEIDERYERA
jgi:uncharacterized OsmC-like protein